MQRLMVEVIGWILTIYGAYFVFDHDPKIYHYIVLVVGIVILVVTLPKTLRKRKSD